MTKTTWWLRVVGSFYVLLTLFNLALLIVNPGFYRASLPFPADELAVRAFVDAWLIFILELGALGLAMLIASRNPAGSRQLIWAILFAEVLRGIVGDIIWLGRGYSVAMYGGFIVLHVVVIATGILVLRSERPQGELPAA